MMEKKNMDNKFRHQIIFKKRNMLYKFQSNKQHLDLLVLKCNDSVKNGSSKG